MSLEDMLDLQLWPGHDLYAPLSIGQEEQVVGHVPADLIHLELELPLCLHLVGPAVNEGDEVLLVPHGNGLSIRGPRDVDVLPLGVHHGHSLVTPCIPHPHLHIQQSEYHHTPTMTTDTHRLIPRGSGQHICLVRMPAQLVHTVSMTFEYMLLGQPLCSQGEDANCFVITTTGQASPITAPVHTVHLQHHHHDHHHLGLLHVRHLGAVGHHLPRLVILLELRPDILYF